MGTVIDAFTAAFRRYNTDGSPPSGPKKPAKTDAQGLGATIESFVAAAISTAGTGKADKGTDVATGARAGVKGADIAAASTVNLGAADGETVNVTGSGATITALGTATAGIRRTAIFAGANTLTHNATSLILITLANIPTAAGDRAEFVSLGSGNWLMLGYVRADGKPLAGSARAIATTPEAVAGSRDDVDMTPAKDKAALDARLVNVTATIQHSFGQQPTQTGVDLGAPNYSLLLGTPQVIAEDLVELSFDVRAVGNGVATFEIVSVSGSVGTVIASYALPTISSTGVKTFLTADLGGARLAPGQQLQISSPAAGVHFANATGASPQKYKPPSFTSGSQTYSTNAGTTWCAGYKTARQDVVVPRGNINATDATNLATLEAQINPIATLPNIIGQVTDSYGFEGYQSGFAPVYTVILNGGAPISRSGLLASLSVPIGATAGAFKLMVLTLNSGTSFSLVGTPVDLVATTPNTEQAYLPADFGAVPVIAGQYLALALPSGGMTLKSAPATSGSVGYYLASILTGTATFNTNSSAVFGGRFTVAAYAGQIEEDDLGPTSAAKQRRSVPAKPASIMPTYFGGSAPAGWTIAGSWAHPSGGMLTPTGANDANQTAKLTQTGAFSNEMRTDRWVIVPQGTGGIIWIGTYYAGSQRPTLIKIDDAAHVIGFASSGSTWAAVPSVARSSPLGSLTTGRRYLVEARRNRRLVTITVTDLVTGLVIGTITDGSNTNNLQGFTTAGYLDGSPFVLNYTGQWLIESYESVADIKAPLLMAIGDSRTQMAQYGVTEAQRWVALARAAAGGGLVVSAIDGSRGMDRIPEQLAVEIPAVNPDWIIEFYGTNDLDANVASLTTQLNALLAWCDANGKRMATVILPPSTGRSLSAINAAKLALPARVRKIRFDLAITVGNDGVTADSAINGGNELHPGPLAQIAMANRLRVDLPEAFQG